LFLSYSENAVDQRRMSSLAHDMQLIRTGTMLARPRAPSSTKGWPVPMI